MKKQKIGGRNNKKKNFMSKKDKEMEKLKKLEMERERRQKLHITLPDEITVGDLALKLKIQSAEIVKRLSLIHILLRLQTFPLRQTVSMSAVR